MRHQTPRLCKKGNGFSWGRSTREGVVIWRLFRRDQRGVMHWHQLCYTTQVARCVIAIELNAARHKLRDTVDEVDLANMGVTQ
jgi:hypothetical protein